MRVYSLITLLTSGEPAPRALAVVAAGNASRFVARGQLAAFSNESAFGGSKLPDTSYRAILCCQVTWCADSPFSAIGRDRVARALAPWTCETGPQLSRH